MTTFLLVRHALCDAVGHALTGRARGVHLNAEGRRQAERLAAHLAATRIEAIVASPLERAQETARAIAEPHVLAVETSEALLEVDFGAWTGRTIESLREDACFRAWNVFRSGTRIPGGEHILEVQRRVVGEIERLRARHPRDDARVALVSHAEPLRAALAWFLGVPIDLSRRFDVAPASVSALAIDDWDARLLSFGAPTMGP